MQGWSIATSWHQGWFPRAFVALLALASAAGARAAGTPAGTVVQNTATVTFTIGGGPQQSLVSAPAAFTVVEIINATLTWQDAANVVAGSPDTDRALAFVLTNTGNGTEAFSLARNDAVAGDQFDPVPSSAGAIYLENGLQPGLQLTGPNADAAYVAGANDPQLAPDESRVVYAVSNIPASLATGSVGRVELNASSRTAGAAGAAPGTSLPGLGQGGVDAVVGASRAQARATGGYVASGVTVAVAKSVASVVDPAGGATVRSGSVLTYRVVVTVSGSGVAQNLVLDDPLPANTAFVANSITVDGVSASDAVDADRADFSAGVVRARFGDTAAPVVHTIEFRVTVQ